MVMAWISIVEPYAAVLTFVLCSFHPAVRTDTRFIFFRVILFRGHLPQTPSFRSAKQILVANFRYAAWARILSDRNIFCTLRGGRTKAGYRCSIVKEICGSIELSVSWNAETASCR